jgi:hypothetical protein
MNTLVRKKTSKLCSLRDGILHFIGPSSGISLLSNPGLTWIQSTFSGTEDVCNTLKSVTLEVANHLQMPKCIPVKPWASIHIDGPRKPIPPEEVVWTYVDGQLFRES